MSNASQNVPAVNGTERALIQGDLSQLSERERQAYYLKTCESLGLNPLTQPFGYIKFTQGGLKLYAKRDATDQLRRLHGVSVVELVREVHDGVIEVHCKVKDRDGRTDEDIGVVSLAKGAQGDQLANAYMKCATKAKRRATLSICGLGFLDESEVDSVHDAQVVEQPQRALPAPPPTAHTAPPAQQAPPKNKPAPAPMDGAQMAEWMRGRDDYLSKTGRIAAGNLVAWMDGAVREAGLADSLGDCQPKHGPVVRGLYEEYMNQLNQPQEVVQEPPEENEPEEIPV